VELILELCKSPRVVEKLAVEDVKKLTVKEFKEELVGLFL
jgi:hypothetical protein